MSGIRGHASERAEAIEIRGSLSSPLTSRLLDTSGHFVRYTESSDVYNSYILRHFYYNRNIRNDRA